MIAGSRFIVGVIVVVFAGCSATKYVSRSHIVAFAPEIRANVVRHGGILTQRGKSSTLAISDIDFDSSDARIYANGVGVMTIPIDVLLDIVVMDRFSGALIGSVAGLGFGFLGGGVIAVTTFEPKVLWFSIGIGGIGGAIIGHIAGVGTSYHFGR